MRLRPLATVLAAGLALPVAAVTAVAPPAGALPASIVVDELGDPIGANGACSLRDAIETINSGVAVDTCAVPDAPVVDLPGNFIFAASTYSVTETMTLRGTASFRTPIACAALAAGNCIEVSGAGTELHLENVLVEDAPNSQVYAKSGAGAVHLRDAGTIGGRYGVASTDADITVEVGSIQSSSVYGLATYSATVSIDHATVEGNGDGGALAVEGSLVVTSSSVHDNAHYGLFTEYGTIRATNTTIAHNGLDGVVATEGSISLQSATVVGNDHAIALGDAASAQLLNTVVAQSASDNCSSAVTSLGYNVADDASCGLADATDRSDIDPGLGVLDPTLPTAAIYPVPGSALIDTGGGCGALDQLDVARPLDGDGDAVATCDVGAVETPTVPFVPEPTDPEPTPPTVPTPPGRAVPATPVSARPSFTG